MPLNRSDLTRKIQSLTDLTPDEKSALLELLNTRKKYGLVWEDKPEKVEDDLRTQFPVLTEVADRRIVGPEGSPNHVLIEGDNLHALTALQYTHEGKVDVIYIDPPYNTGNKDFVYNDHFVDKEDQWRHSKWLSFMEKRLKLAKSLLKETGVIFISIDDNEQAQLRLLCDEVFGGANFLANVIWEKSDSPKMDSQFFSVRHDHILVYSKDVESVTWHPLSVSETPEHYDKTDKLGRKYYLKPLRAMGGQGDSRATRPTLYYPILSPDNEEVYPVKQDGSDGAWRWSREKVNAEADRIEWTKGRNGWNPNYRIFADDDATRPPETIWFNADVGSNRTSKAEIKDLCPDTRFDTPKPLKLVKQALLLATASHHNAIALDFFAGSGTTLHATMALNAEDGGSRQCILVTNNENNICEEVTYERNRRVIQGYTNAKGVAVAGLTANSLRYYKTAFVGRERSQKNRRDLTRASVDLLCLKENSYAERPDLSSADRRVFEGPTHLLFVVFDPEVIPETVGLIAAASKPCKVYVFSPGAYAWDDEFEEVKDKITLCALPEALIQAFQKVLPAEGQALYNDEPEAQE